MCVAIAAVSCQKAPASSDDAPSPTAKRYTMKGRVVSVNKASKKATIDHQEIPGYMDAMTMEFPVHDDWVWDELVPGAEITAELVVDNKAKDPFWLEKFVITAPQNADKPPVPVNSEFGQIGQNVPDFTLTNQDGKPISIKDFRGKALAITFIYARCPLPDYCIRMSTNFSDLANQLKADAAFKDKIELLSISFDPANDTPEKLRSYGIGYLGNDPKAKFDIWQLAVGKDEEIRKIADYFGLRYEIDPNDKTKIDHSLRTVVIAPDGKVAKVFSGNDWSVQELKKALTDTLSTQSN